MEFRKVRPEVEQCGPNCPMYYPIAALNNFISGKGELQCPKKFCSAVINSIDEKGNLICSKTGKKSSKMEGFFDDNGKFIRYDTIEDVVNDEEDLDLDLDLGDLELELDEELSKEDDAVEDLMDELEDNLVKDLMDDPPIEEITAKDSESQEYEDIEIEGEDEIIEVSKEQKIIEEKLKTIEQHFIRNLEDAAYFFTQCTDIDPEEKTVTFFNTKNNLISYKSLEKLPKAEREAKMLRAHEYRMTFKQVISIDILDLQEKLDVFYKSLYESLQQAKAMSCDGCRWERAGRAKRAMDCANCVRNDKCKLPEDKKIDNYS